MNSKTGSGIISVFFVILFLASIALNVAFLSGCIKQQDLDTRTTKEAPHALPVKKNSTPQSSPSHENHEAELLKNLATWLSIEIPENATPDIIALSIKQALDDSLQYRGEVLSVEASEECKAAIPTTKDTETFEAYHVFIKKIAGKRILVLDN